MFENLMSTLYEVLIVDQRYILILQGLRNTLMITFFALFVGCTIGIVIALIKVASLNNKALKPLNWIADLYLTVIRGTPVLVQLFIINGALLFVENKITVAVITFGINSGAYVAEIIRSGILSIDKGQTEAGRSLGLTSVTTMKCIVMPQAIKNILPALGNEFITLLKETSVAGVIGLRDLTKAGENIYSRTFDLAPLYLVALVYLVLVVGMTAILRRIERRLSKSDHR